jgi:hypothetical protein
MYLVIYEAVNIFTGYIDIVTEKETLDDAIEFAKEKIDEGKARVRIAKIIPKSVFQGKGTGRG